MKKTLTINLAGFVFHVEEDAYATLENYINSIHQYFKSFEGSKEIIQDIESRIAEKFFDIRENEKTEAITKEHIDALIASLGTVADFKEYELGEKSDAEQAQEQKKSSASHVKKTFRRDLSRKKIGGVAAGLANYLEVDPLWVRLVLVIGFFGLIPLLHFSNVVFLGYVICWIAIPGEYPEEPHISYKRFYRDPDNKVIGGVMAGISKFTGWDLGLLRVLAVISVLAFGTGVLAYLIILIITPEAKTITDKMAMEGEPITLENIENNIQKSIQSENKTESFFGKILLFPFRIFAAILPAFKAVLIGIRWFVQYLTGTVLIIVALALLVGLFMATSVGISGMDHGNVSIAFGEAIPLFLLVNDFPIWSFWSVLFVLIPFIVYIGIGGVSLLANRKFYNKTFSYVAGGMAILGWIGIFAAVSIVGRNFSRTAASNKIVEFAAPSDTLNRTVFDIHKESQESIFEKMLGDYPLTEEFIDEENMHDFNRGGFNRVNITLEGYAGNKIQVVEFFKSNGKNRAEAQANTKSIIYGIKQDSQRLVFDSHFGLTNQKFRNQRVNVKVLIPYGMKFSMTKEFAYFMNNLLDSGYFNHDDASFNAGIWLFDQQKGLISSNRFPIDADQPDEPAQDWNEFERRFEEKNQRSDATY